MKFKPEIAMDVFVSSGNDTSASLPTVIRLVPRWITSVKIETDEHLLVIRQLADDPAFGRGVLSNDGGGRKDVVRLGLPRLREDVDHLQSMLTSHMPREGFPQLALGLAGAARIAGDIQLYVIASHGPTVGSIPTCLQHCPDTVLERLDPAVSGKGGPSSRPLNVDL